MELTTKLTKIKNKTKGLEPLFLYNTDLNLNSFLLTHLRHKAIKDKKKMLININMYNIHFFNTPFLDSCFIGCKNHEKACKEPNCYHFCISTCLPYNFARTFPTNKCEHNHHSIRCIGWEWFRRNTISINLYVNEMWNFFHGKSKYWIQNYDNKV